MSENLEKYFNKDSTHRTLYNVIGQRQVVINEMKKSYNSLQIELKKAESKSDKLQTLMVKFEDLMKISDDESKRKRYSDLYDKYYLAFKDNQTDIALIKENLTLLKVDGYLDE